MEVNGFKIEPKSIAVTSTREMLFTWLQPCQATLTDIATYGFKQLSRTVDNCDARVLTPKISTLEK